MQAGRRSTTSPWDAAALAKNPQDYDDKETAWCSTSTAHLKTLIDEQGGAERGLPAVGARGPRHHNGLQPLLAAP